MNECMNEWNDGMKLKWNDMKWTCKNEWMHEWMNWWNKIEMKWNEMKWKCKNEWMHEWIDGMIEWMKEWLKDWMNEWIEWTFFKQCYCMVFNMFSSQ